MLKSNADSIGSSFAYELQITNFIEMFCKLLNEKSHYASASLADKNASIVWNVTLVKKLLFTALKLCTFLEGCFDIWSWYFL